MIEEIRAALNENVSAANTINNEGLRVEMKVNAIIAAFMAFTELYEANRLFPYEPAFLGPGANDAVFKLIGADEAQVLADAAAVEAVLIGGDVQQSTGGYADHASEAPSTSLYDVMPERAKLERMTVGDLKALAERHGITLADGNKGTIIDTMVGPKASS